MAQTVLTGPEKKLLAEMARGAVLKRRHAGWRAGTRSAQDADIDRLRALDLIEGTPAEYRISGPGMAFLRRRQDPDSGNRLMAKTADMPRAREAARQGARRVNRAEEPLGWLHARGKITDQQFEAGQKLRADFMAAGGMPRITMAWDAAPAATGRRAVPDGLLPGERITAAKRRFEEAMDLVGRGPAEMLRRTVCIGEGMETAEKAMTLPVRSGRVVLMMALDRIADFYRL
ncbi:DUF6456 domain-containing protein [Pacificimonas flava]|uniref:DUF6456 domain-containing protein n=1 Tax=Pacificimonas flava TaxID=1234595 RepID=M2U380_9SPHN|nr:DUF6456 domain-containing protein [Pacificimonas flava]EMD82467.1 hypothetical protein C725_2188 [Pacificimonas flava]MBB5281299.1 hypothetical protein [Pacificimonas flava]